MIDLFQVAGVSADVTVTNARLRLDRIQDKCRSCVACDHARLDDAILWEGNALSPDVAFLVSQPYHRGHEERALLTGASRQLFERMLAALQLPWSRVLITSALACRLDDGESPHEDVLAECKDHWKGVLKAAAPAVLVVMGEDAAAAVFGMVPVAQRHAVTRRLYTEWLEWGGIPTRVIPSPGYMTRNPRTRQVAWEAMQAVTARLRAAKEGFNG